VTLSLETSAPILGKKQMKHSLKSYKGERSGRCKGSEDSRAMSAASPGFWAPSAQGGPSPRHDVPLVSSTLPGTRQAGSKDLVITLWTHQHRNSTPF